jgi:hypothetical protein
VIGSLIFTLPADAVKGIGDLSSIYKFYKDVIQGIREFGSTHEKIAYRIVFDVDMIEFVPACGYPLVYKVQDVGNLLCNLGKPTPQLFIFVAFLGILTICENRFDDMTQMAIASVAASSIFVNLFPGFDPRSFTGIALPPLFFVLWELHSKHDPTLLPRTLAVFQNPAYSLPDIPDDMWIAFVKELCLTGKKNYTKLLDKIHPIPLNISNSLQGLAYYEGLA